LEGDSAGRVCRPADEARCGGSCEADGEVQAAGVGIPGFEGMRGGGGDGSGCGCGRGSGGGWVVFVSRERGECGGGGPTGFCGEGVLEKVKSKIEEGKSGEGRGRIGN